MQWRRLNREVPQTICITHILRHNLLFSVDLHVVTSRRKNLWERKSRTHSLYNTIMFYFGHCPHFSVKNRRLQDALREYITDDGDRKKNDNARADEEEHWFLCHCCVTHLSCCSKKKLQELHRKRIKVCSEQPSLPATFSQRQGSWLELFSLTNASLLYKACCVWFLTLLLTKKRGSLE